MELILCLQVCVFIYCAASYILRKYPSLLHNRKRPAFNAVLISHRGGAAEHLENTMTAFEHSAKLGAQMFELDCHITSDGHVLVAHDNNLIRMCGKDIRISETKLSDIPPMLTTQRLDFDRSIQTNGTDTQIILLEDLFQRFPKMPMNIDIKINKMELINKVHDMIVKYKRESITVWGSGQDVINKQVKKINPDIGTLFSLTEVIKTTLLYYVGLLPFVSLSSTFYEIPLLTVVLNHPESFPRRTRNWWLRLLLRIFNVLLMNCKLIEHIKERGIPVYIFVLNNEVEWRQAAEYKVSGIMTDFPTALKTWLKANPEMLSGTKVHID